jgi:hypothetical protein
MAIGVMSSGSTAQEAEDAIRTEYPQLTVLRSRRMDLSDLRQEHGLSGFPPDAWVVVVEYPDPATAPLPPQDDPEGETEARYRRDMIKAIGQLPQH